MGPWSHGECRNGGFPDWLQQKSKAEGFTLRSEDPRYLALVRIYYSQMAEQIKGLRWKDGGPIIGGQVENELTRGPSYLLTLKKMAREVGLDFPLYTLTGWGGANFPQDELIPLFGFCLDNFWDVRHHELGPIGETELLLRQHSRQRFDRHGPDPRRRSQESESAGAIPLSDVRDGRRRAGFLYPASLHLRPRRGPAFVHETRFRLEHAGLLHVSRRLESPRQALDHARIARHAAIPTTCRSSVTIRKRRCASSARSTIPTMKCGRCICFWAISAAAWRRCRRNALQQLPSGLDDSTTLRWAVRSDGKSGFIFINNYQRVEQLPAHENVRLHLELPKETLDIPHKPLTIPSARPRSGPSISTSTERVLKYATAQPLCRLADDKSPCYVFFATPAESEFVFDENTVESIQGDSLKQTRENGTIRIDGLTPGRNCLFDITTRGGKSARILLLSRERGVAELQGASAGKGSPADLSGSGSHRWRAAAIAEQRSEKALG